MVEVGGFSLPIPPIAGTKISHIVIPPKHATRTDLVDGILPLTDEDVCPINGKHANTKMKNVPADYLDWLYGQSWFRTKYPRAWAYVVRHEDVITKELKAEGKA